MNIHHMVAARWIEWTQPSDRSARELVEEQSESVDFARFDSVKFYVFEKFVCRSAASFFSLAFCHKAFAERVLQKSLKDLTVLKVNFSE